MAIQEIDLSIYAPILWKRRFTVLLGAAIPAVVVAAALLATPPARSIAYTYSPPWEGATFPVVETYFYGSDNLARLANVLRGKGFEDFASKLDEARKSEKPNAVKDILLLDRLLGEKERTKEKEDMIQQLVLQIRVRSYDQPDALGTAIRDYFEQSFPLYHVEQANLQFLSQDRVKMSESQAAVAATKRTIKATQAQLDLMRKTQPTTAPQPAAEELIPSIIMDKKQFLPIEYQIRAIEGDMADSYRKLQESEMAEAFYARRLQVGSDCAAKIKDLLAGGGTIAQYAEFLQAKQRQSPDMPEAVSSRLTSLETSMLGKWRIPQEPTVRQASRGTVLFSGLAFAIALPLMMGYVLLRHRTPQ